MLKTQENKGSQSAYQSLLPIYPLIAQQCVDDYNLNEGICLDIGTGNGYIGTEIAKITNAFSLKLMFVSTCLLIMNLPILLSAGVRSGFGKTKSRPWLRSIGC